MKNIRILLVFLLLFPLLGYGKTIQNLTEVIAKLEANTNVSVLFPKKIPLAKTYYAYGEITNSGYVIYIDATPTCHGIHACNIGSVTAVTGGNPQIYYDMQNRELTVPVKLQVGTKAYFTPGHAMGDYWPPMLVWRKQNVLYKITWQLDAKIARQALIAMANSMRT